MSWRDLPVVGFLGGALVDVLAFSGDFLFVILDFLLANALAIFPLLRVVESLAKRLPWLPAQMFEHVVTASLVALLVIYLARLGNDWVSRT